MNNTSKVAGIAGVVWAGSNTILGLSTGKPPELDAPGGEISSYLHDHRGLYLAAIAVFVATLPLLFGFVGELHRRIRNEGTNVAAALVQPALATMTVGMTLSYLLAAPFVFDDGLGPDASDGTVRYAYVLGFLLSLVGNVGAAVVVAVAAQRQRRGARAGSSLVAGVMAATAVGGLLNPSLAMIGGLGLFAFAIWTVVVGIGMARGADRATAPAAVAVATA